MAYKALYRTYRPTNFEEVAGQKHVVQTLKNAVLQDKIAHAYLFCGPRGTGKTSIAKIFAKMINCTSEEQPCGICDNCKSIQENTHPDLIEIDAASNNGVEEVRTLIDNVKYAPIKGKYKVYIIDEVHMMTPGAFNALLKTIEEPPAHVVFILATTEPQKILKTIISRCQRFDFTKVGKKEIIQKLSSILEKEHITCEQDVIELIAELSDGGLRDALSILDQCIAYANDNIQLHHINEIYGTTTVEEKMDVLMDVFENRAQDLMNHLEQLYKKGIDLKRLTSDFIELLKESVLFEYTKDTSLLSKINSDQALRIIQATTTKQRFEMIHLLMDCSEKYKFASNVTSYFEVCMMEMMSLSEKQLVVQDKKVVVKEEPLNVSRETFNTKETKLRVEKKEIPVKKEIEQPKTQVMEPVEITLEPIEEVEIPPMKEEIKPLDHDFIIGLLRSAKKDIRKEDEEKIKTVERYCIDLNFARQARLLRNVNVVGSAHNFIILATDTVVEANEINDLDKKNEFYNFSNELFGNNKKIIAITKEEQMEILGEFRTRSMNGTLPDPIVLDDVIIVEEETHEASQEEVIVNLFGKENITIEEE